MNPYRILTINPGSTSTKVAVFEGGQCTVSRNISHDAGDLERFTTISEQLPYREKMISAFLEESGAAQAGLDAVVGRGGGLMPVSGGIYAVDRLLVEHARAGANGVQHPAQLGPQLAERFARRFACPAYVVNPPDTDELQPTARLTGIRGVYRNVHLHALNQKQMAIQHAEKIGRRYEDCNFIVCHIGGGISIAAHRKGRMIDGNDIAGGEGPMAPTRCGTVPVAEVLRHLESGASPEEMKKLCTKTGGFVSLLGTSDAKEVSRRAEEGDRNARLVWDTMIYQITKSIGAMAAVLAGEIDGILLGGGMAHNEELVGKIRAACGFLGPISVYPGEFEMEAMAAGAERALRGTEPVRTYTGNPVWDKENLLG